jgi:enoyl-CoA hydratase
MDEAEANPLTRAVVVTGVGKAFCAGAELETLERAAEGDFSLIRDVYAGFLRVLHSPLLTVAAVNGPAVGAGFNLALACDLRIAGQSARFVSRFPALRILPGGGHTWLLSRLLGSQRAILGSLLDEPWTADTALRDGLVVDVLPDPDLIPRTIERLGPLADLETEYVQRFVASVRTAASVREHGQALELEAIDQEWSTTRQHFLDGLANIKASIRTSPLRREERH